MKEAIELGLVSHATILSSLALSFAVRDHQERAFTMLATQHAKEALDLIVLTTDLRHVLAKTSDEQLSERLIALAENTPAL